VQTEHHIRAGQNQLSRIPGALSANEINPGLSKNGRRTFETNFRLPRTISRFEPEVKQHLTARKWYALDERQTVDGGSVFAWSIRQSLRNFAARPGVFELARVRLPGPTERAQPEYRFSLRAFGLARGEQEQVALREVQ
jgi:hypothetical protein